MGRRWRFALGLALLVLALPGAPAQQGSDQSEACRAPVLSLQPTPTSVEPGASYSLLFAIENTNEAPVQTVRAGVSTTAPAGWTAIVRQRELTLGPRNSGADVANNELSITAPNRGSGAASGNITLLVTFVCTKDVVQTSASQSATIPVEIRGFAPPWSLLGAFVLLLAGVVALGLRRLRRGVALHASQNERSVEAGKSVKFTFVVENRRSKPQRFHVLAVGAPASWAVHLALETLELEPGEEKSLWMILKAPLTASAGTEADVQMRLDGPKGENISTRVRARVVTESS